MCPITSFSSAGDQSDGQHPAARVVSYYNDRADCENAIKKLQSGFALGAICLDSFWATEAALSLAVPPDARPVEP
jgi:hypothetical protein